MKALFPKAMQITLPNGTSMSFSAGVHELPDELVDHWWLKANGVSLRISSVRPT